MKCNLCPRKCNIDRSERQGFCRSGEELRLAKVMLHKWEEPCISGTKGSGAVFFSGCSLRCCFCQNYKISHENFGADVTAERLAEIFKELEDKGAHNINLVNPTHFVHGIIKALEIAKPNLPVVYNCGGYESVETLKMLEGYVDIYLPDFKYSDGALAKKYSAAADYPDRAKEALAEMHRQAGEAQFDKDGIMQRGMIIRHLVLPNHVENSIRVLDWIKENMGTVPVSIMSQYTPFYKSCEFEEINRRLSREEYERVMNHVYDLELDGFMQELSSAKEEYVPEFDLSGVL